MFSIFLLPVINNTPNDHCSNFYIKKYFQSYKEGITVGTADIEQQQMSSQELQKSLSYDFQNFALNSLDFGKYIFFCRKHIKNLKN